GGEEPVEVETETLKGSSGAGGSEGVTSRDLTESFDNQSRADNASIARDNLNQDRISNNDLADRFSNRNRISNRERLRSGSRRR
ncbi:MAG: hypothetical protein KC684_09825, partial [Candidatus Omnitrophica bacterium]|nr:hypothetical protein [Candidatus Omnitrophota bacterium]